MHRILSGFLKLAFTVGTLLCTNIAVTPANASLVDFNFSGTVNFISPGLSSAMFGPTISSGLITYNDGASDTNPLSVGQYDHAIMSGHVQFSGGYSAILGGSDNNFIQIEPIGSADVYRLRAPVNGSLFDYFEIDIIHSPSAFNNNLLPPTLGTISSAQFHLVFGSGGPKEVSGPLTAVPLPPAVILFGAGLVALIGLGARNWQRTSGVRLEV